MFKIDLSIFTSKEGYYIQLGAFDDIHINFKAQKSSDINLNCVLLNLILKTDQILKCLNQRLPSRPQARRPA